MVSLPPRLRPLAPWVALAAGLVAVGLAYGPALDGPFVFDDFQAVLRRAELRDLGRFLRGPFWAGWAGGARPLTDLTFAASFAAGGAVPWNFHLAGLSLHLAAGLLAFLVARAVLRLAGLGASSAAWVGVAAALAFALHPLQSEAVAYTAQRSEVLASGLALGALAAWLAAERRGLVRSAWPWLALGAAAFLLALGAKPVAAVAPLSWLLVMAVAPGPPARPGLAGWRRRLLLAVPLCGVSALAAGLTISAVRGSTHAGLDVPGLDPLTYLLTQATVVPRYLGLLAWPAGQSIDWDVSPASSPLDPPVLAGGALVLLLLAGAVALAWRARRREGPVGAAARAVALGVLWFLLWLSPTSSLLPLADAAAEHRVYLAALGPALALATLAWLLLPRLGRWGPPAALLLGAGLATALWLGLRARAEVWASPRALWTEAVARAPEKARPLNNLADVLARAGDREGALRLGQAALTLVRPGEEGTRRSILENLGTAQAGLGLLDEAQATLEAARRGGDASPALFSALASVRLALGDSGGAAEAAEAAVAADVQAPEGWAFLAAARARMGRPAQALEAARRAQALDPDLPLAAVTVAEALYGLGRRAEACAAFAAVHPGPDRSLARLVAQGRTMAGCDAR